MLETMSPYINSGVGLYVGSDDRRDVGRTVVYADDRKVGGYTCSRAFISMKSCPCSFAQLVVK
jgi:hypothetical protein